VTEGRPEAALVALAISKPASSIASVMARYDSVVGWRMVTHWERIDTWTK
jgi:hypothetical protein